MNTTFSVGWKSIETVEDSSFLSLPEGGELVEVGLSTVFLTGDACLRLLRIMHPTGDVALPLP